MIIVVSFPYINAYYMCLLVVIQAMIKGYQQTTIIMLTDSSNSFNFYFRGAMAYHVINTQSLLSHIELLYDNGTRS